jgi:hypothetical protein
MFSCQQINFPRQSSTARERAESRKQQQQEEEETTHGHTISTST